MASETNPAYGDTPPILMLIVSFRLNQGPHHLDPAWVFWHCSEIFPHTVSGRKTRILPEIVEAACDLTVLIDSGFRRGTDVLTALALGAHGVLIGRPFLFAASLAGEAGVARAIGLLAAEIDRDMALLGLRSLDGIDLDMLPPRFPRATIAGGTLLLIDRIS